MSMSSLRKVKKEQKKKKEKARKFNAALPALKVLRLERFGYCANEESVFTVKGDLVLRDHTPMFQSNPESACFNEPFCRKDAFLDGLRELNIYAWKRKYEDRLILDGLQWELELLFGGNCRPVKITGINAYPEQFDALLCLTGLEESDEQDQN